jgi:hypothetical protein
MLKFNTQCIGMEKIKEDEIFVWYKFNVDVYIMDKPREIRYGVFRFNKKRCIETTSENYKDVIQIIKEDTNPIFWDSQIILIKCLSRMLECKKREKYPDKEMYASG